MRSIKSRLRELAESTTYRKDFNDLKKSILQLKSLTHKERDRFSSFCFVKIDIAKFIETKRIYSVPISLKEIKSLLRSGNINEHWVEIPSIKEYEDFKTKYGLNYFFDPVRSYSKLILSPFVPPLSWSFGSDTDGTKITMTVDISYQSKDLEDRFKIAIKSLKKMWNVKAGRKERYSDDDIYRVRLLDQQGLSDTDIFRTWFSQYKDFRFTRDYEIGGKTVEALDAVAKLEWIKRLIQRARERRP